tara:strand:- start:628 stop:1632 length:1005 start_codon:yes stop_codon:yes gene_type:complete
MILGLMGTQVAGAATKEERMAAFWADFNAMSKNHSKMVRYNTAELCQVTVQKLVKIGSDDPKTKGEKEKVSALDLNAKMKFGATDFAAITDPTQRKTVIEESAQMCSRIRRADHRSEIRPVGNQGEGYLLAIENVQTDVEVLRSQQKSVMLLEDEETNDIYQVLPNGKEAKKASDAAAKCYQQARKVAAALLYEMGPTAANSIGLNSIQIEIHDLKGLKGIENKIIEDVDLRLDTAQTTRFINGVQQHIAATTMTVQAAFSPDTGKCVVPDEDRRASFMTQVSLGESMDEILESILGDDDEIDQSSIASDVAKNDSQDQPAERPKKPHRSKAAK